MRAIRWLMVALVVLAGAALVLDRVGVWLANRAVADQVAQELAERQIESAPPEVNVTGFPFLTQVAAGRYGAVEMTLRDVGRDDLRLPVVELTATGVEASVAALRERSGPIYADQVTGRAVIGYDVAAELAQQSGLELASGEDGTFWIRLPIEVLGMVAVVAGRGEVVIDGGALRVRLVEFVVAEPDIVPSNAEPLIEQAARAFSFQVPLPELPYGLRVESVQAEPGGLVVSLSARDVQLAA